MTNYLLGLVAGIFLGMIAGEYVSMLTTWRKRRQADNPKRRDTGMMFILGQGPLAGHYFAVKYGHGQYAQAVLALHRLMAGAMDETCCGKDGTT